MSTCGTCRQCSILKSSTHVKCHFGRQRSYLFLGHFTNMCYAKFSPVIVKASPKTNCHKIQWLQFANRNIFGLLYWHSNSHFQIPIVPAISTMWLWLGTNCNLGLASTTLCERGFSKQNWVKSDHRSQLKFDTWDALTRGSWCILPMENMDWARIFDTWRSPKNWRALPLELDDE